MTTSERPGEPAAQTGTSPSSDNPSDVAAMRGTQETVPQASAGTRSADDTDVLKQEIERTREQLGETVEQLAAKTDVKTRARAKAAELAGRVKSSSAQVRAQAVAQAGTVRGQFAAKTGVTRHKAVAVGAASKTQLQARAVPVWQATPEPLRRAVTKGAGTAKQRRMPLAAAAVTLIAGYLTLRWWKNR